MIQEVAHIYEPTLYADFIIQNHMYKYYNW